MSDAPNSKLPAEATAAERAPTGHSPEYCAAAAGEPDRRAPEPRGLECPRCGCRHFRVVYTRAAWGGRILRRRGCRHCGRRVTTVERRV